MKKLNFFRNLVLATVTTAAVSLYGQNIITVAGNGTEGYSGDGGIAASAQLAYPYGLAISKGNVFISEFNNYTIRKIDASGNISTAAGINLPGFSGDNGLATGAELTNLYGMTSDAAGNIYVADFYNSRIRKIDTAGIITTVAGNGDATSDGDGGAATAAGLNYPCAVDIDAAGNMYIAEQFGNKIRKVDTAGIITTFAGTGAAGPTGDNGLATKAKLNQPNGVYADKAGNIYIADTGNNKIRKVDATTGIITTVVGAGVGFAGDGGQATLAKLSAPTGLVIDDAGNMFIADKNNNRIRKVDVSGIISTVAGNGTAAYGGDGAPAIDAQLNKPNAVLLDAVGNLLVADAYNHRVRKIVFNPNALDTAEVKAGKSLTKVKQNPVVGALMLQLNPAMTEAKTTVQVYNVAGQQVLNAKYNREISVAALAPGMYLARVSDGNHTETVKFIKK